MPRSLRWWGGAAALVVVTACSGVPTSGPVHLARTLPGAVGDDDSTVRQLPPGPSPDETPTSLVDGFLNALVDSDTNYGVAHAFLAPDTTWSTTGVSIYEGNPTVTRTSATRVDVEVTRLGRVDARGDYTVDPGQLHVQFRVARIANEWRISRPPAGVLLSTTDAERLLGPAEIYYLNHDESRLVPDPILVSPNESSLATTLMTALLGPPNPDLAASVVTAAPAGTSLVGNVPIDSQGVAEVDLSSGVQQASSTQLVRLLAQIVWTLRQVPSVTAVRVLANGAPLATPSVGSLLPVDSFAELDPDAAPVLAGALASDNGRVVPLAGALLPLSLAHLELFGPARSSEGTMVAALADRGRLQTLEVGTSFGPLHTPLAPDVLSAPAFDPAGDALVAEGVGPGASLVEVTPSYRVHSVAVARATLRLGIDALSVSRDGARVALTAGPAGHEALYVGALGGTADRPAISTVTLVIPASESVSGVAWAGADEIVTTVRGAAGHRLVETTGVDGYQPHELGVSGLPSSPSQVAAAPGQAILAAADGAVWSYTAGHWRRESTGSDPSYAG